MPALFPLSKVEAATPADEPDIKPAHITVLSQPAFTLPGAVVPVELMITGPSPLAGVYAQYDPEQARSPFYTRFRAPAARGCVGRNHLQCLRPAPHQLIDALRYRVVAEPESPSSPLPLESGDQIVLSGFPLTGGTEIAGPWREDVRAMERLALLLVTAHPGDELLLGGTLARHADSGVHVALACATGSDGSPGEHDLRCACKRLGVAELYLLGYQGAGARKEAGGPQGPLAAASACRAVGQVVEVIRRIQPQVMVTFGPDGVDGDPDHVALGSLATQAFGAAGDLQQFPVDGGPGPYAPAKLYYLGLPAGLLQLVGLPGPGTPDEPAAARDDVTRFVDLKIEAARCYRSLPEPEWATLFQLPPSERRRLLGVEYLALAQPQPAVDDRTNPHLFAGIP